MEMERKRILGDTSGLALQYKPFTIPLRIEKICLMIQCYSHVSSKHQTAAQSDVIFFWNPNKAIQQSNPNMMSNNKNIYIYILLQPER